MRERQDQKGQNYISAALSWYVLHPIQNGLARDYIARENMNLGCRIHYSERDIRDIIFGKFFVSHQRHRAAPTHPPSLVAPAPWNGRR